MGNYDKAPAGFKALATGSRAEIGTESNDGGILIVAEQLEKRSPFLVKKFFTLKSGSILSCFRPLVRILVMQLQSNLDVCTEIISRMNSRWSMASE